MENNVYLLYKNPNGCPIHGTFYVSHQYTNYAMVQKLWNQVRLLNVVFENVVILWILFKELVSIALKSFLYVLTVKCDLCVLQYTVHCTGA